MKGVIGYINKGATHYKSSYSPGGSSAVVISRQVLPMRVSFCLPAPFPLGGELLILPNKLQLGLALFMVVKCDTKYLVVVMSPGGKIGGCRGLKLVVYKI